MLVPVGVEEEVTEKVTQSAIDLAIPGSEDTTRVIKKVDDGFAGQHFASEDEAQSVATNMQDKSWVKDNCAVCTSPLPASVVNSRKIRRRDDPLLTRRGNSMTTCCRLPATISEMSVDLDETYDAGESVDVTAQEDQEDATDHLDDPIYNPEDYNVITESSLVPAPPYTPRDIGLTTDLHDLVKDLNDLSTGVVPWSPALREVTNFHDVFTSLRKVFTGPATDPLYTSLKIIERDGKFRLQTFSEWWITSTDPTLKPLQDFVNAAVQQGIDTVVRLKNFDAAQMANLKGTVEFFYTAPSQEALTGVDPRGFHVDKGLMQFGAADTPGLIIRRSATGKASRVPVMANTFQLMKGSGWDMNAFMQDLPNGPTWHSVFGAEMAKEGRVSVVMSIFTQGTYI